MACSGHYSSWIIFISQEKPTVNGAQCLANFWPHNASAYNYINYVCVYECNISKGANYDVAIYFLWILIVFWGIRAMILLQHVWSIMLQST